MKTANASCPPDAMLVQLGLGKLDAASADAVSQHLESCPTCRERAVSLSGDRDVDRRRAARGAIQGRHPTFMPSESVSNFSGGSETPLADPRQSLSQSWDEGRDLTGNLPAELANQPDYEILKELGEGGIGKVYLARNRPMDRLEVLKIVNPEFLEQAGALERFQREVRAAAQLNHANIVAAYRVIESGGSLALAMEYVDGHDLAHVVRRRGPLPVANAAYYAHQAAVGLDHAFKTGMVHRDIKPSNLILAIDGKRHIVKILDFGLAKSVRAEEISEGLTKSGQMLGTPEYAAPEQILDAQKADIRADIYSLGCTLYFLLAGTPPFGGTNLYKILHAHQTLEARPIAEIRSEVSAGLSAVVAKMMAKDPAARFQTPIEVAKALIPFFKAAAPVTSQARPSKLRARWPWVAAAGGSAGFFAVLVGLIFVIPNGERREGAGTEPPTTKQPAVIGKQVAPDAVVADPVDATKPSPAAILPPISVAALKNDGAFGFPQARAQVIFENDELRLSFCNDKEHLYVQAILWNDFDRPVGAVSACSNLTLVLAANLRRSVNIDRRYHLDANSDLACQVLLDKSGRRFTKTDSQGRGLMRYLTLEGGRGVRVDSFLVPLAEIKRRPRGRFGVIFQAIGASPSAKTGCGLFIVMLTDEVESLQLTEVAPRPETTSTASQVDAQTPTPETPTAAPREAALADPLPAKLGLREADALFGQWMKEVHDLPAEKQVDAVAKKLQELNPGFDGKVTPKVEGGVVTALTFTSDQVKNIAPVSALKDLKSLTCRGSAKQDKGAQHPTKGVLSDLSPLAGMQLLELDCSFTSVADLLPLKDMGLKKLACGQTQVSDLFPLKGMPLTSLAVDNTPVSNLAPLEGIPLTILICYGTKVTDLSPLRGMQLSVLNLGGTPTSDLSPLHDLPLTTLICSYSKVQDLSSLRGKHLTTVCLCGTPVVDLSPLTGMQLRSLHLAQTQVSDVSPLAGMPLEDLTCDYKPGLNTEVFRSMKSLAKINNKPAADFWQQVEAKSKANEVPGSDTP